MRSAFRVHLGSLCAIPFLFSLMAFSSLFFANRLIGVMAAEADQAERRRLQQLLEQLASLFGDVKELEAKLGALDRELADLRHEKAKLDETLRALLQLEKEVATLRLSREERDKQAKELGEEIGRLREQYQIARREAEENEQVPVGDLVPGGSEKPRLYVECDGKGAWIMPARTLLDRTTSPASREAFLRAAEKTLYVVFLVRPDGIEPFRQYRQTLEDHNRVGAQKFDYGYEPIDLGWVLVYPREGGGEVK